MSDQESPQKDRYVHNLLPPKDQWPVILPIVEVAMSGELNCVETLLDQNLREGRSDKTALINDQQSWTYRQLADRVNQIASRMVHEFDVQPGNRVLIRGGNSPHVAAIWLAIQKVGAIGVTSMSLLRSAELQVIMEVSLPVLIFCEHDLKDELHDAVANGNIETAVIIFDERDDDLFGWDAGGLLSVENCKTHADDISIVAFTSGTTGKPKATVHFHRDILAICHTVCRHMLMADQDDIFIGTAPLAFTFGLGGLLIFPLFCGSAAILKGRYNPVEFVDTIERHQATICFTVPTYYQQILKLGSSDRFQSLRLAVSSGEALPLPVRTSWSLKTGIELVELLGSTEMLHAFIGARGDDIRPGYIGPAIEGYKAAILDANGQLLPAGEIGRLAVQGPTGCRYLNDDRQMDYVQNGWNITGDACLITEDGYVAYHTRFDDMIITAGYNVSGLEVENALLDHPKVNECAVIGVADKARGQIVAAYVVVADDATASQQLDLELKDYVKKRIAPYKYPRKIVFLDELPRNESGKIQRFRLLE
ncbi:MAG: AMP-binding protein [Hyphomicrobiales bacterium]|nr:AMP-binding protein [Hyphomicrobiales bacterium]